MALAARVKCMKITSKKSIDVKVGSYLKALKNKKNWGSDKIIYVYVLQTARKAKIKLCATQQ